MLLAFFAVLTFAIVVVYSLCSSLIIFLVSFEVKCNLGRRLISSGGAALFPIPWHCLAPLPLPLLPTNGMNVAQSHCHVCPSLVAMSWQIVVVVLGTAPISTLVISVFHIGICTVYEVVVCCLALLFFAATFNGHNIMCFF